VLLRAATTRYCQSFPTRRSSDLHPGSRDLAPQIAGEALDLTGVVAHGSHDGGELALDLGDVARDLADAAGQDVEVVEISSDVSRSEEHTSELPSRVDLVCRRLLK